MWKLYPRNFWSSPFLLWVTGSINSESLKSILKQNINYFNNPKINYSFNFIKYSRSIFTLLLDPILKNFSRKWQPLGSTKFGKLFFEKSLITYIIQVNKLKHNGTHIHTNTQYRGHIWWLLNKTQISRA